MSSHKELKVYQKAMDFVTEIYRLTNLFPSEEKFGLTSQMRRAAISIPSNIADGAARKNTKEYVQFLYYSLGSLSEIETQLDLAKRLGFVENIESLNNANNEIIYMPTGLIKSLTNKIEKSDK